MPFYDYECPVCGIFERFLKQYQDYVWHDCSVSGEYFGSCLSEFSWHVPAFESLENERANSWCKLTGKRLEHGFYNHLVTGPRGDGYFSDRAEYKKWMKNQKLEEVGPGALNSIKKMAPKKDHKPEREKIRL